MLVIYKLCIDMFYLMHGCNFNTYAIHFVWLYSNVNIVRFFRIWVASRLTSLGEMVSQGKANLQAPWLGISAFITLSYNSVYLFLLEKPFEMHSTLERYLSNEKVIEIKDLSVSFLKIMN